MKTAIARSSNGDIEFNPDTGMALGENTHDIAKFDVDEWRQFYPGQELDECDILDIGYWTLEGHYEPPISECRQPADTKKDS